MIKKLYRYIGRSWRDEIEPPPHPQLKVIPPFLFEVLSYLIKLAIVVTLLKLLLQ